LKATFEDLGNLVLKNIERPVQSFSVRWQPEDWQQSTTSDGTGAATTTPQFSPTPLPLPDKPSIAVLPFQNMSGDPEQEYFADGIAEDIITALARFRNFHVIARNSSFTYRGQAVDIKRVGRELGVRYVLEGSVRKATGRVRITGQLIDADTGNHAWADRYDGQLEKIFDLQDEITNKIAAAITPAFATAELQRVKRKHPQNLDAWDLSLRSQQALARGAPKEARERQRVCA
jgi:adenylate cyclase